VDAINRPLVLEYLEIAADGCQGSADRGGDHLNRREAIGVKIAPYGIKSLDLQALSLRHAAPPVKRALVQLHGNQSQVNHDDDRSVM
jgi:hypothetical protein